MKKIFFILGVCLLSSSVFAQDRSADEIQNQTIPELLRRPEAGEAIRYPKDVIIGELGQGESPDSAYKFARDLLSALIAGNNDAMELANTASVLTEELKEELNDIEVRSYHLGGGRIEADGSVSFLVRFLGREESITGELYITNMKNPVLSGDVETADTADFAQVDYAPAESPAQESWRLDDLILEEKRPLSEIRDSYRYDFTPYERFY